VAQSTTLEGVLAGVRAGLGVALLPNAGGRPSGLSVRGELPDAATVHLRMVRPTRVVRSGGADGLARGGVLQAAAPSAARPAAVRGA